MKKLCLLLTVSLGIAQSTYAQPTKMDIGPSWMSTFGDYFLGNKRVAANKGLSINLGDEWRGLYDTETLRLVNVSKGGIEWGGTPWTGGHGSLVSYSCKEPLLITANGFGWSDAAGSFDDKRNLKGYGDMPHGKFSGHYRHGNEIVLEYTINGTQVFEMLSRNAESITRSFQFGARKQDLVFVVSDSAETFVIDGVSAKSDKGLEIQVADGIKLTFAPNSTSRLLASVSKGDSALLAQIAFARGAKPAFSAKPNFTQLTSGGAGRERYLQK
jgi:hypothetical protein